MVKSKVKLEKTWIHIHNPQPSLKAINITVCLDCNKRTRMIQFFTEWYGWNSTCLKCGRRWCDGEWMPLEFARGVRKRNIELAKKNWRRLKALENLKECRDKWQKVK